MSAINDNKAGSSLREQAFSVFCDATAENVAGKTKQMRAKNEKTAPLVEQLQNVKIFNDQNEIASVEVFSFDAEDAAYFIYHVKYTPLIPHDHLKRLSSRCNGLLVKPDFMTEYHHLKIQDNEIKASYNISDQLLVMGRMINHVVGTLDDVQRLIDGHNPQFFHLTGLVLSDTGSSTVDDVRRVGGVNNELEGSTFVLEKVCIAKHFVHFRT